MGSLLYFKAGPWTPESAVEDPEAVRQLHREFLRAGSDVMQVGFMQFRTHTNVLLFQNPCGPVF